MTNPALLLLAVSLASVPASGCALHAGTARPTTLEDLRAEEGWILLDAVPFVAQEAEQDCGAACLAMVLRHWGVAAEPRALDRECAVEGEEGLRATALRDAARRREMEAFLFRGGVSDLAHELRRGRPVVVGLGKDFGPMTLWHYVVVVGLHPRKQRIAALDPATGPVCDTFEGFAAEWGATKEVTLVVYRPGRPPLAVAAGVP